MDNEERKTLTMTVHRHRTGRSMNKVQTEFWDEHSTTVSKLSSCVGGAADVTMTVTMSQWDTHLILRRPRLGEMGVYTFGSRRNFFVQKKNNYNRLFFYLLGKLHKLRHRKRYR
uniref:Uncharacterized protein n=1 Tax=Arundo donax TaxID=35708 RepID=A0A0A9DV71_ARUDO